MTKVYSKLSVFDQMVAKQKIYAEEVMNLIKSNEILTVEVLALEKELLKSIEFFKNNAKGVLSDEEVSKILAEVEAIIFVEEPLQINEISDWEDY